MSVLHVDLDQFIAAVEVRRHPELAGRPVVVGGRGDPTERGVVATASYEARALGVGSGTPLRVAARRCPDAVFLPVDKPAYEAASAEVVAVLRAQTWDGAPLVVEVVGWDEDFLARSPRAPVPARPDESHAVAERVRAAVHAGTGLRCSVGIGENKLQAKVATELAKPDGVFRLGDDTWFAVVGERDVRVLPGVGATTARRLGELGVRTVADLARTDPHLLAERLGERTGPWVRRRARGVDTSPVDDTPWVPRARGREETFQVDLEGPAEVTAAVRRLAALALEDVRAEGRPVARVVLKVRLRPFTTLTRSRTLPVASSETDAVADAAVALLDRLDEDERSRPVRLLGVRLEMVPPPGGYDA